MRPLDRMWGCRLWFVLLLGASGCDNTQQDDRPELKDPSTFVPVSGLVTLNGKPVTNVVVTFLPPNGPYVGHGETDAKGRYALSCVAGKPGIPTGDYKISLSYLVSPEGQPQGLGVRSAMVVPASLSEAKEQFPPEYSDFGRTKLAANVGPQGGDDFNFDVKADVEPIVEKPKDEGKEKPEAATGSKGKAPAKKVDPRPAPVPAALEKGERETKK